MKVRISLFALIGFAIHASAQSSFFIQPSFGAGISKIERSASIGSTGTTITNDLVVATNYRLGVGYCLHKWQFRTGIGYFGTGYKQFGKGLHYYNVVNSNGLLANFVAAGLPRVQQTITYHSVLIPLIASYQINLSSRFSIVPSAGIGLAYNINEQEHDGDGLEETMSNHDFGHNYKRLVILGMAGVAAQYAVNKTLSVHLGPEAHFMVSNMAKTDATQYNNAYLLSGGISLYFRKKVMATKKIKG